MRGVDHQQSQSHWADDAIRSELELQMILSDKCRKQAITLRNPMVNAKPAKTKTPAINVLTICQHVVHLGTLRNSFTASTSLV